MGSGHRVPIVVQDLGGFLISLGAVKLPGRR
jgi:hypothetical protein